jgi:hypothetical protein
MNKKEKAFYQAIFDNHHAALDKAKRDWTALTPEEQHDQYEDTYRSVNKDMVWLNELHAQFSARMGHRKKFIYSWIKHLGLQPKTKKESEEPYNWTRPFWQQDLTLIPEKWKAAFCPLYIFNDLDDEVNEENMDIATTPDFWKEVTESNTKRDEDGKVEVDQSEKFYLSQAMELWTKVFKPEFAHRDTLSNPMNVVGIKVQNRFNLLEDVDKVVEELEAAEAEIAKKRSADQLRKQKAAAEKAKAVEPASLDKKEVESDPFNPFS